MTTKSNGANYGAVVKIGIRVANNKPPKRRPYGYDKDDDSYDSNNKSKSKTIK